MRIGFVIPYYMNWGGPAQVVQEVAVNLVRIGHEVTVFTTDAGPDEKRAQVPGNMDGVEIQSFPNLSPVYARRKRAFFPLSFFRRFSADVASFDVIHVIEYRHLLGIWAIRAAKKAGVPVVMAPHGSLPNALQRIKLKQVFDLLFGRNALDRVDHFQALTEKEKGIISDSGIPKGKISVIPNGVDFPAKADADEIKKARAHFGLKIDDVAALFMARLHPDKGLLTLLEVLAEIRKRDGNAKLLVAGPDDGDLERARRFVADHSLSDVVQLLGFVSGDEKRRAFVASDMFVSLSTYETMPVTVLEAMAYGLGVLVSEEAAVLGLKETNAGQIVPVGDLDKSVYALLEMIKDKQDLQKMGKAGRELVKGIYTWPKVTDDYLNMYRELIRS